MTTLENQLPTGSPAPDFELEAIVSDRLINPHQLQGQTLLLLFHNQNTVSAVVDVQDAVRQAYPSAADVIIASVVDLDGVPRMFRGMVRKAMAQGYEEASRQIPDDWDPVEYVVLLPDWKGEVSKSYGVGKLDEHAAVVVIDPEGNIVGSYKGEAPGQRAVELLNNHFAE